MTATTTPETPAVELAELERIEIGIVSDVVTVLDVMHLLPDQLRELQAAVEKCDGLRAGMIVMLTDAIEHLLSGEGLTNWEKSATCAALEDTREVLATTRGAIKRAQPTTAVDLVSR